MVEPASTSAASMKVLGSVTSALIGRSRSFGVARAGSREDRLQVYRMYLDALVRWDTDNLLMALRREKGPWDLDDLGPALKDLLSTLSTLKMCAPMRVIEAAQDAADKAPVHGMENFEAAKASYRDAVDFFIEECRRDLNFDNRPWQVWRWHKLWAQWRFLKGKDTSADATVEADRDEVAELEAGLGSADGDSGAAGEVAG